MPLEIADGKNLSAAQLQRAFALTHNGFLVLNQLIAKEGRCFVAYLPAWRRARDSWAAFYSKGWSPGRYSGMQRHRLELLRWRNTFSTVCNKQSIPLYAAL